MIRVIVNNVEEMKNILNSVKLQPHKEVDKIIKQYKNDMVFIFIDEFTNNFEGWCSGNNCLLCDIDCNLSGFNFDITIEAKYYLREKKLERICT